MGILAILGLIFNIISGIPKIIELIEIIIELLHALHGNDKKEFLAKFRAASEELHHSGHTDADKAKYQAKLEDLVCEMHKVCYPKP